MEHVAVIGVGRIGLPVAARIVQAGYPVRAYDIRAERKADVVGCGALWADDAAAAAAGARALLTVLPGNPELRALMLSDTGGDGLLSHVMPNTPWVDLTSTAPDVDEQLARAARERGIGYLDAGVSGGVDAAAQGQLTLYVGGDADLLDRLRPILSVIAKPERIHHMGADGAGHLTKLLVNLLWFGQSLATGEALLLGQRAGLDVQRLTDALAGSAAGSEFLSSVVPRLLAGDYLATFGVDRCVEELDALKRFADRAGTPFGLSAEVVRGYRRALDAFGAVDGELLGVAHLERLAGRLIRPEQPGRR
jgi:3-hydroxyisobutyrate dehydrogenase